MKKWFWILLTLVPSIFTGCWVPMTYEYRTYDTYEYHMSKIGSYTPDDGKTIQIELRYDVRIKTTKYKVAKNMIGYEVYVKDNIVSETYSNWEPYSNKDIKVTISNNDKIEIVNPVKTNWNGVVLILLKARAPYLFTYKPPNEIYNNYNLGYDHKKIKIDYMVEIDVSSSVNETKYESSLEVYDLSLFLDKIFSNYSSEIENKIKDIINKQVSEKLKKLKVEVQNIDSRYPINNVSVTVIGNIPKSKELLSPSISNISIDPEIIRLRIEYKNYNNKEYLFEKDLLNYAINNCPDYIVGSQEFSSSLYGHYFNFYYPSTYLFQLKHPSYYYLEKDVKVDNNTQKITFLISELGTKLRVKIEK